MRHLDRAPFWRLEDQLASDGPKEGLPVRLVIAAVQVTGIISALAGIVIIVNGDAAGFIGVLIALRFVYRTVA